MWFIPQVVVRDKPWDKMPPPPFGRVTIQRAHLSFFKFMQISSWGERSDPFLCEPVVDISPQLCQIHPNGTRFNKLLHRLLSQLCADSDWTLVFFEITHTRAFPFAFYKMLTVSSSLSTFVLKKRGDCQRKWRHNSWAICLEGNVSNSFSVSLISMVSRRNFQFQLVTGGIRTSKDKD